MKKSNLMTKLVAVFLFTAIFTMFSCEKSPDPAKTYAEIFNALPANPAVNSSNITFETVNPGNGPAHYSVFYKNEKIKDVYKGTVSVMSLNFAYTLEPYNSIHFILKERISGTDCFGPVINASYGNDIRNIQARIDSANDFVYFYAEQWTQADVQRSWDGQAFIGKVLYFRYSICADVLTDESGKQITLSKN